MTIIQIAADKKRFLPLLLEADPYEPMIDRYLERGELFAAYAGEHPVCVAVVTQEDAATCELKNLATEAAWRGRGYAHAMLAHLFAVYAPRYRSMLVGTAEAMVPFYQLFGFVYSHTLPQFFIDNYPEPLYDGGVQCVDMVCLRRPLGGADYRMGGIG